MSEMQFNSVAKMLGSFAGMESLADELKQRVKDRRIVKALQAMRLAKNIQQSQVADELGCSQSRISKIESGDDCDLSIGEVEAYAKVLNYDVNIGFLKRNTTAVERIKLHAMAINRELEKLAECAHSDEKIASGVVSFFGEAFFNLVRIMESSAAKLPLNPDNGEAYVTVTACFEDAPSAPHSEVKCIDADPTCVCK